MPPETAAPPVTLVEVDGRGRSLFAAAPLTAGQIILKESPILLYTAFPLLPPPPSTYCTHCFKLIPTTAGAAIPCPTCSLSLFCSTSCLSLSLSSSHTPWLCQSLEKLQDPASSPLCHRHVDLQVQARFLISAYNLAAVSPSDFQTLLSVQGEPFIFLGSPELKDATLFLHTIVLALGLPESAFRSSYSVELTAALLAKDKINGFGIMEPFATDKKRSVRAYGIYPRASFFNHDCLPNACRFDYFDGGIGCGGEGGGGGGGGVNTDIVVRLIHDVPEGREICLSYFPVDLKYSERQKRLKEDYGFVCDCDRCKVEANWSDQEDEALEEDDANGEEEEAAMDEDEVEEMVAEDDGGMAQEDSDFPHAYFFLKYMCNRDNCGGTLAPLPPSGPIPSTVMECNVCGSLSDSKDSMDGNVDEQ